MDLSTITVDDFKALFTRDFAYLPVWDSTKIYNAGKRTYYPVTELFYDSLVNGNINVIPGSDPTKWKIVADDVDNYVTDADIERAMAEARIVMNQSAFSSDDNIKMGFLYLTAMYLVNDLRTALGGISGNSWLVKDRQVGNVRESYGIPSGALLDPSLYIYTQNPYGMKYLSLVWNTTVGNIAVVRGATLP